MFCIDIKGNHQIYYLVDLAQIDEEYILSTNTEMKSAFKWHHVELLSYRYAFCF